MKNIIFKAIAVLCLLLLCQPLLAQKLLWDVDFKTIFDNREGNNNYGDMRTFFQTELTPEVGVSLMNDTHQVKGGVTWLQPLGNSWDGYKLLPIIYYQYNTPQVKCTMGFFSRDKLIEPSPGYLWSDSCFYAEPNIRGVLMQYRNPNGFAEGFLDWYGMQSEKVREAFKIQVNASWRPQDKVFMLGATGMMNHLAKRKYAVNEYVMDLFIAHVYAGLNLSHRTVLDSLTIKVGPMASFIRDRKDDVWRSAAGGYIDVCARYKWFEIKNTLYAGKSLIPYHEEYFAPALMMAPYYQSDYYNCTEVALYFIRNQYVNLKGELKFNVAKDCFNFYQQLAVSFYIDQNAFKKKKKAPEWLIDYLKTGQLPNFD